MKRGRFFWAAAILLTAITVFSSGVSAASFTYPLDTDGELIIVIDPGHGGDNLGADYNGYLEKEMNMIVANAMYEELLKYEGITVYLTHTDAEDSMTIRNRAKFAASVNADFLFCLHFNMSPGNKLFGSEVWISAFGDENREGYRFASVQMETMGEMGLFLRGIKTRFNEERTDYYGILRYCTEYGIPAALIEHCHLDHEDDVIYCDSYEDLVAFGVADARAVAKYFGLRSEELGVDYSTYARIPSVSPGALYAQADETDPDVCAIEEEYVDAANNRIGILVTGCDYDTPMLYYSYSIDGGETYTPYLAWPDTDVLAGTSPDTFSLEIEIPDGVSPRIILRGMNQYDRYTESNMLTGYPVFDSTLKETAPPEEDDLEKVPDPQEPDVLPDEEKEAGGGFKAPQKQEREKKMENFMLYLKICLAVAGIVLISLFVSSAVSKSSRRRHKKKTDRKK